MKHPTEPSTRNRASAVPYLPADIVGLMDTHAVRIDETSKHHGSWGHSDVATVRRTVRDCLRHFDLLTHSGHAVPLYWLHEWLTSGPYVGPRTLSPADAWQAHLTLISALNQPDSGLHVVPTRRTQHAS